MSIQSFIRLHPVFVFIIMILLVILHVNIFAINAVQASWHATITSTIPSFHHVQQNKGWIRRNCRPNAEKYMTILTATKNGTVEQQRKQQPQQQQSNNNNKKQISKKPSFAQSVHTERIRQQRLTNKQQQQQQQQQQKQQQQQTTADLETEESSSSPKREYYYNSDSLVGTFHKERLANAGRPGTKRFVDPCKVYIGNLPYNCTTERLKDYVSNVIGLPSSAIIHQCKVIYDWKTMKSKGYGFVVVTEPIYATVFITKCTYNATLGSMDERRLTISQGKSKEMEKQLYIEEQEWKLRQEKLKKKQDEEDMAIQSGIMSAKNPDTDTMYMDPGQISMLKRLDPDLAIGMTVRPQPTTAFDDTNVTNIANVSTTTTTKMDSGEIEYDDNDDNEYDDDDYDDDRDIEFLYDWETIDNSEVYDDSDDGVDGVWNEKEYDDNDIVQFFDENDDDAESSKNTTKIMNRQQRRNVTSSSSKKRKLPHKGFG